MCSQFDHPPYEPPPPVGCQRPVWSRGETRPCGSVSGIETWVDQAGGIHQGCRYHLPAMKHRYPETGTTTYIPLADARVAW